MDDFLKLFCTYLIKKPTVKIADTLKYIENYQLYTTEIINNYKNVINAHKICKQVNNEDFLSNYDYNKRIDIFFNFFCNLHSYAKNLIKNFDIYSSKTIETSSLVMKDNIMLFPHYKRYMETLLGYEFDAAKSEWAMNQKNSWKLRYKWAAVCIITAIGYQQIEELNLEQSSSGSLSSSNKSIARPSIDKGVSSGKWHCRKCGLINDTNCGYCSACNNKEEDNVENIPPKKVIRHEDTRMQGRPSIADNRLRNKIDKWTCQYCTLDNDNKCNECIACLGNREGNGENKAATLIKIRQSTNGSELRVKEWSCDHCSLKNSVKNDICGVCKEPRRQRSMNNVRSIKEKWRCERCSWYNECEARKCDACSTLKKRRTSSSVRLRHGSIIMRNQWECDKCTFINNTSDATCAACLNGKLKRSSSESALRTNVSMKNENLKSQKKWICVNCSTNNNITLANCESCFESRVKIDPNVSNRSPKRPNNGDNRTRPQTRDITENRNDLENNKLQADNNRINTPIRVSDRNTQKGRIDSTHNRINTPIRVAQPDRNTQKGRMDSTNKSPKRKKPKFNFFCFGLRRKESL